MATSTRNEPPKNDGNEPARSESAQERTEPPVTPHDLRDGTAPYPSAHPGEHPIGLPAPGGDPDSIARAAKAQFGTGGLVDDDVAQRHLDRTVAARALVAERNNAGPARVREIDAKLREVGFDSPLPTTVAQRGAAPLGRSTGPTQQA